MLFSRRHRVSPLRRAREFVWPRSGVRRAGTYLAHRVRRLPGTPYSIAAGLACGAAVSFTPFMGLHFLLGALLALAMRGNIVASAIGTATGNPWTFPLIWSWIYTFGNFLLGASATRHLPAELTLSFVFERPLHVLYPMVVGSVPSAVTAWIVVFAPCYVAIARYRAHRRNRLRKRARPAVARRLDSRAAEGEG
ncbi:hypothetical protein SAMN05216241_102400 [Limimonas halophila]|uniref:DUF2062 domain-containing protein n=1 Tax=Limimonas halophila TaxID=1082479 RepID=A0A1G7P438_9PROT|nr:DUF2062 domain-containing protein [Limimonas halophila]SDF80210.1 hypothetical protein SAMN05216241_102400 [Limimonas halophila]